MADRQSLIDEMTRTAAGDREAFSRLYRATSAKLFGICLRILNNRPLAEEVLQEVYVSVWRRAGQFEGSRASPITWLAAVARNQAIDVLRRESRSAAVPGDSGDELAGIESGDPTPYETTAASQERQRLQHCLEQLEAAQRTAVSQAFYTGAPYSALARAAGVPEGTMKSWIRRSLLKLRECLQP